MEREVREKGDKEGKKKTVVVIRACMGVPVLTLRHLPLEGGKKSTVPEGGLLRGRLKLNPQPSGFGCLLGRS